MIRNNLEERKISFKKGNNTFSHKMDHFGDTEAQKSLHHILNSCVLSN